MRSPLERLADKSIPEPMSGCWLWLGSLNRHGYGRFSLAADVILAHRASWELHRGPVQGGLHVLHRCDMPCCVNPDHLFLGTNLDNIRDRERKGREGGFPPGAAHPSAKLTAEMVLAILEQSAAGATGRALAHKFGVHESTVGRIVKRQLWKERQQ